MWWTSAKTPNPISRLPTIARLAERVAAAAGRSGNLELVPQITKLGGNGPIMANALASFGLESHLPRQPRLPQPPSRFPRFRRPRRGPQHRRTRHHRRPGVRRWKNHDWQTCLAQGNHLAEHPGPLRSRKIHRQIQRLRSGRLRQLDHAPLHERPLGSHPARRLPRPHLPAPPPVL